MFWLGMAAAVLVVLVLMNRSHICSLVPYLLVGAVLCGTACSCRAFTPPA